MCCPVRENASSLVSKFVFGSGREHRAARWTRNLCSVLAVLVELPALATVAQFYGLVARFAVPRVSPVRSVFVSPK